MRSFRFYVLHFVNVASGWLEPNVQLAVLLGYTQPRGTRSGPGGDVEIPTADERTLRRSASRRQKRGTDSHARQARSYRAPQRLSHRWHPSVRRSRCRRAGISGTRSPREKASPGFVHHGNSIIEKHYQQSTATVAALKAKYETAVFGKARVWDLIEKLALCIDETDSSLYCTSQLIHVQQ